MQIVSKTILSGNGSTRATAYGMSNKIVRRGGTIFAAWLDYPSDIRLRAYNLASGT